MRFPRAIGKPVDVETPLETKSVRAEALCLSQVCEAIGTADRTDAVFLNGSRKRSLVVAKLIGQ